MISNNTLATILRETKTNFWMCLVEMIKPRTIVLHLSAIPTKVVIVPVAAVMADMPPETVS